MADQDLAITNSVQAYRGEGKVYIVAEGTKPTPCHQVTIAARPELIYPPRYEILWHQNEVCAEVLTPYRVVSAPIPFPASNQVIHIRHRTTDGSEQDEAVNIAAFDFPPYHPLVAVQSPLPQTNPVGLRTGTGVADGTDFGAALSAAIADTGPDPHPYPDKLYHYEVISTSVEIGGIDGRYKIRVTVRG